MWTVISLLVNDFIEKIMGCVWYQYDISPDENRLVVTLQFGTAGINGLKYHNVIEEKQCKTLEK